MDPNACWTELCGLINQERCLDDADELRILELTESLLGWIGGGGFLPVHAVHGELNRAGLQRTPLALSERYTIN